MITVVGVEILFFAEVMDKEPAIGQIWLWALSLAFTGFVLSRVRWWLAFVTLPLTLLLIADVMDSSVGPAIRQEAGIGYVAQAYTAFGLCLAIQAACMYDSIRSKRVRKNGPVPTVHNRD